MSQFNQDTDLPDVVPDLEEKVKALNIILIPLNGRILMQKDDAKNTTKGGIVLPDSAKVEVLTGRVVRISKDIRNCPEKYGELRLLDKVLVNPRNAVPVELEPGNKLWMIPVEDIMAVFKNSEDYEEDED